MTTTLGNVVPFWSREAFMRAQRAHLVAILNEVRGALMRRPSAPSDFAEVDHAEDGLPYLSIPLSDVETILVSPMSGRVDMITLVGGLFAVIRLGDDGPSTLAEDAASAKVIEVLRSVL